MRTIEERLKDLLGDYEPKHLVLLGDLVHDQTAAAELARLLKELAQSCQVVLIAGNHDRRLEKHVGLIDAWRSDGYYFHHGHCANERDDGVQIIGHHHPAATIRDGAGLRLKLPAFVQAESCWILPAFSPWAAGTEWPRTPATRVWICSPQRILRVIPGSAGC